MRQSSLTTEQAISLLKRQIERADVAMTAKYDDPACGNVACFDEGDLVASVR
jgi:hypothetical protein